MLTVSLSCADACASCKSKTMCGADRKKSITIVSDGVQRATGDKIILEVERGVGLRAVMWAYMIPVVLVIGSLLLMQSVGLSDLAAGLTALGILVVYYILIKILGLGDSVSIIIHDDE